MNYNSIRNKISYLKIECNQKFKLKLRTMTSLPPNQIAANQTNTSSNSPLQDQQYSKNQTFPVNYDNECIMVDPSCLINSSKKFKELIDPFINRDDQISNLNLSIIGNSFSHRSIRNFLQLCQNLPSDVQDSEMKEVCEIAKMFQADKIYNIGADFIKQNIDPNFNIPDEKYNGSNGKSYLVIEGETNFIHHDSDISELSFSDDDFPPISNRDANTANNSSSKEKDPKMKSIIYEVGLKHRPCQLSEYHFGTMGQIMYTAKKQGNIIYIGKGNDVHISKPNTHVANIIQNDNNTNIIHFNSQKIDFGLKYVPSGLANHLSIEVTFTNSNNKTVSWTPMAPKFNSPENRYYLNFEGEYHHKPLNSKKNIVLQNSKKNKTFIIRKMEMNVYEVECLPAVDPLIAFIIGISDIVGPYNDPLVKAEFY